MLYGPDGRLIKFERSIFMMPDDTLKILFGVAATLRSSALLALRPDLTLMMGKPKRRPYILGSDGNGRDATAARRYSVRRSRCPISAYTRRMGHRFDDSPLARSDAPRIGSP